MNQADRIRERLTALYETGLLDSPPEQDFDRLTRLTCHLLRVPVALVSLIDEKRQFFKSSQGLPEPWASQRQTPLASSFCQHVVNRGEPLVINNALEHPLVCDNPAVNTLGVVSYLGIPLLTPDSYVVGSLCAIDHQPREWTDEDVANLADLAALVMKEIELRFHLGKLYETERFLQQQTQELAQTNQDLQQFVHIAAHDLRNPLNTIIGFAELLRKGQSNHLNITGQKLLGGLLSSSNRMKVLLEDLLAYARSGHQDFAMEPVDLPSLLDQVLEDLKVKIGESNARVEFGQLPVLLGDETYLRLLFQNLIDNAIKYRGQSDPHIQIFALRQENWWQISLQDNSRGIERKYLEAIFEPFQRIHPQSQKISGSGIGLSTCQRIVERHGGQIWVDSNVGVGSAFCFTLPALTEAASRQDDLAKATIFG